MTYGLVIFGGLKMKFNKDMHLPAYPLFVKDPFFQLWMPDEDISDFNAKFYTDKEIPLIGLIK